MLATGDRGRATWIIRGVGMLSLGAGHPLFPFPLLLGTGTPPGNAHGIFVISGGRTSEGSLREGLLESLGSTRAQASQAASANLGVGITSVSLIFP